MARFIDLVNGVLTRIQATVTSVGAGSAGDIVALGADGKLDNSVLPTGIGAETLTITTSEALAAGDLVNVVGTAVQKADNSNGRQADGFVLSAFGSGVPARVYTVGVNTAITTPVGPVFLGTAGAVTSTAPTAAGTIWQKVGVVTPAGLAFNIGDTVAQ